MPRYKLILEYDGTPYRGWQRQENLPSVQQALEEAMARFAQHEVKAHAAGRTDTGVHALGQVVHIDLEKEWRPGKIQEATNGILKLDEHPISVLNVEEVDGDFDARFSATFRTYRYRIINRMGPLTVERKRAWWIRFPLDVEAMDKAAKELLGTHDFSTFRSTDCQAKSPIRTMDQLDVKRVSETEIEIIAGARAFLHNQIRSFAGSLKMIGDHKWSTQDLIDAREARDRKRCGPVAPACGLYFLKVDY
ncbi:MAG: tRNA pseudouridine(38-40) synthase TruA [Pseudomonadota bacterium]